jgi:DNA-binding beta-propeller fold protein YncE
VTFSNGLAVLRNNGTSAPSLIRTYTITGLGKGLAVTPDGKDLIAANGSGATVISEAEATAGAASPVVGTLTSSGGSGAVGVRVSPDGKFAFVTLQNSQKMAVFNLAKALSGGFSSAFVGFVPLFVQPVGIGASPDGQWLYVTSFARTGAPPAEGTLSVVSVSKAETDPAHAVKTTVAAGCSPARVITTGHGATVWVTARDSNALLGFSASRLLSEPAKALIADVKVGPGPIGLTSAAGGSKIIVADSNQGGAGGGRDGALAVVSPSAALAGKSALLGLVSATGQPRQLTLAAHGVVLVTVQVTGKLESMKVASLP